MASDEEFHAKLDKFVRERIKRLRRDNPRYFSSRLNAHDLLKYMKGMPDEAKERIERAADRDGNIKAVDKLIDEMIRYGEFAFSFLNGLVENSHLQIAQEIISGLDIESFGAHRNSQFLRDLIPEMQADPPPYSVNNSEIEDMIRADQDAKFRSFASGANNSNLQSSDSLGDNIAYIANHAGTLVNDTAQEMNIIPSTSTRDENISTLTPLPSSTVQENAETNSTEQPAGSPVNTNFCSPSGLINRPTNDTNHYFQTASLSSELSDIHESQVCISDPEHESETFPKKLGLSAMEEGMQNSQQESSFSNSEVYETVVKREENPMPDDESVHFKDIEDGECELPSSSVVRREENPMPDDKSVHFKEMKDDECELPSSSVVRREENPMPDDKSVHFKEVSDDKCELPSSSVVTSINESNESPDSDHILHGWSLVVWFFVTLSVIAEIKKRL